MPNRQTTFSKKFLWGASSSAHQVEGGQYNQWTVWELENAKALAAQAPYLYDDLDGWDAIKTQAQKPQNYVSGKAVGQYKGYEADLDLVRNMNMNTYRLSVEWSRVQPQQDAWDASALEHYKRVLQACKKRGIEPVVTLFHTTLPVWFSEQGGFEKRANVRYFTEFAERFANEMGALMRYVITLHEPEVYMQQSYVDGVWPPQVMNKRRAMMVSTNLVRAHKQTAAMLHAMSRRYKVSIAKNYTYIYPGDDSWLSVRAASWMHYVKNTSFLRRVVKSCDFIGLNYYASDRVYGYRVHNPEERVSDVGLDLQPQYLARAIADVYEAYNKPIFITESGIADAADEQRQWWLQQSIAAVQSALKKEVPVMGYIYSNLTDAFEWEKGFWPKYGLYSVDTKTLERTPRPSALWLAKIIKKLRS